MMVWLRRGAEQQGKTKMTNLTIDLADDWRASATNGSDILKAANDASATAKRTNRRGDHLAAEAACRYVVTCTWQRRDRVNYGYLADFHGSEAAAIEARNA